MPNRVEIVRNLIAQQRHMGLQPQEIHMNAQTRAEFAAEAGIKPEENADRRSLLSRLRDPNIPTAAILRFEGVRIVDNEAISGGGMLLRPLQLMGDPLWLDRIQWSKHQDKLIAQAKEQAQGDETTTPWHQKVSEAPADAIGDVLSDLGTGGGVNPTTVLIKACEDLDKVQDVVVLRFYKNGSIDLCSTFNKYAVVGSLQAALNHVIAGDDR